MSETLRIIKVQREHGLARLTLSDGTTVRMPRALLKEQPYKSGMPFDPEAHRALVEKHAPTYCLQRAVGLLALRSRTEKELCESLARCAYSERVIAKTMAVLTEAGYINDEEFAGQWAASRTRRGTGPIRLRMELRQKGIDSDTIDRKLESLDEEDILTAAIEVAEKAAKRRVLSDPKERQKILAALARRGYPYETARKALDAVRENSENV